MTNQIGGGKTVIMVPKTRLVYFRSAASNRKDSCEAQTLSALVFQTHLTGDG